MPTILSYAHSLTPAHYSLSHAHLLYLRANNLTCTASISFPRAHNTLLRPQFNSCDRSRHTRACSPTCSPTHSVPSLAPTHSILTSAPPKQFLLACMYQFLRVPVFKLINSSSSQLKIHSTPINSRSSHLNVHAAQINSRASQHNVHSSQLRSRNVHLNQLDGYSTQMTSTYFAL